MINMPAMGRPRKHHKHLPLGVKKQDGRYYCRPTNLGMREVFAAKFPGRKSIALPGDEQEMRRAYAELFILPAKAEAAIAEGTVAELIARYRRDELPRMVESTRAQRDAHLVRLEKEFGARRYAKSEVEAARGEFLRSMDVTRYLRAGESDRPVAANREIQTFSRVFRKAKTAWGYTEYNPCLQVEYNTETPRDQYIDDGLYFKVYDKALPVMQCMMDIAAMCGPRPQDIRGIILTDVDDARGLWTYPRKRKKGQARKKILHTWTPELRACIDRALELRKKVKGNGRAESISLFLTRMGKAYGKSAFDSLWERTLDRAGVARAAFHFHDIRAKNVSDDPSEQLAGERAGHDDPATTRRVYRRKPIEAIPLPLPKRNLSGG